MRALWWRTEIEITQYHGPCDCRTTCRTEQLRGAIHHGDGQSAIDAVFGEQFVARGVHDVQNERFRCTTNKGVSR